MSALNTKGNSYADAVGADLFDQIPKAVWAAIAVSALTGGGDQIKEARGRVIHEWAALHDNGIVAQNVPGNLRKHYGVVTP